TAGCTSGCTQNALIARYSAPCLTPSPTRPATNTPASTGTRTPTVPPTQTPGGPSATPVPSHTPTRPPTHTPTRTLTAGPTNTPGGPTPCPIQFSDVDQSNPFYVYIRCLVCRGIVSGYNTTPPCLITPCILPGANVTRGQMSKFV